MKRKEATGILLMLLAASLLSLNFIIRIGFADEAIYIRPDGSIDPSTAPMAHNGNTYTFVSNISEPIVIQKDSIVIDGNGYWLLGYGQNNGISLNDRSSITLTKTHITGFRYGINMSFSASNTVSESFLEDNQMAGVYLESSTTTNITDNTILSNYVGILLMWSNNTNISGNAVKRNQFGIWIQGCSADTVTNNTIANNENSGMWLDQSSTTIFRNDFIKNNAQAVTSDSNNTWDNGYPYGGNYWSDNNGTDLYKGPYQNETGSDGICDTPYVIDGNNTDRYPPMRPSYSASLPGDLNGDGKVSLVDLVILALAYGSKPGDPDWNPVADINGDGKVSLADLVILAQHYGQPSS